MSSVFVGRQQELERLTRHLRESQEGRGRVVFITGEPGAGKSTLITQFMVDAALAHPETRIIGAACSEQYGAAEPYQPFVEAFRSLLDDRAVEGGRWQDLKDLAKELAPTWISAIPLAGGVIAATITTATELKRMGGGVATAAPSEEALFFQYTELFLAAAARHPIVLFIDDLHWADRASVSLLTHLARRVERERVLILGTYRPADVDVTRHAIREAKMELERYRIAEEMPLPPLDSAANAELVREELGAPPAPDLLDWLERHAGANPLFFGELLKWLSEQGYLREHHGESAFARVPESIEIPRSAEATIERRLSRLDAEVYRILEYASVEGNEFASTTLARLLEMDELALEEALEPLARVHRLVKLVDTRDLPDGELASIYHFGHSLIQDVLHRNLQGKRRILLHRKMAEILERTYAANTAPVAHKLAIHFDEGRLPAKAYEFALAGAEGARRLYANRDAIELIKRALRNAQQDAQKLEASSLLGDTYSDTSHFAEALAAFTDALAHATALGDAPREIALTCKRVRVDRYAGGSTPEHAEAQLKDLAARAGAIGARRELCEILWVWNTLPNAPGERSVDRAREALAICEGEDDAVLRARARFNLARALLFGSTPDDAAPHVRDALELYTRAGDRSRMGACQNLLGVLHVMSGRYREGSLDLNAAAESYDAVGDPVMEAGARNNLGVLLTRLGEFGAAEENLREAIRLNLRMDATAALLQPLENLAELFQAAGRWQEARDQWRVLLERARASGYWNAEVIARCGIGVSSLELGDGEAARAEEAAASEILVHYESWSEARAAYHYLAAKNAEAAGEFDGALHFLATAEEELASRDRYVWAIFRLLRAEITRAREDDGADGLARDALAVFEQIGSARLRERAQSLITA